MEYWPTRHAPQRGRDCHSCQSSSREMPQIRGWERTEVQRSRQWVTGQLMARTASMLTYPGTAATSWCQQETLRRCGHHPCGLDAQATGTDGWQQTQNGTGSIARQWGCDQPGIYQGSSAAGDGGTPRGSAAGLRKGRSLCTVKQRRGDHSHIY